MQKKRLTEEEMKFILHNRLKMYVPQIAEKLNRNERTVYSFLWHKKLEYKKIQNGHSGALSPAEEKVMHYMAQGLTDKEIAEKLFVAPCTVATHKINIYAKYGVSGNIARVKAVLKHLKEKGVLK